MKILIISYFSRETPAAIKTFIEKSAKNTCYIQMASFFNDEYGECFIDPNAILAAREMGYNIEAKKIKPIPIKELSSEELNTFTAIIVISATPETPSELLNKWNIPKDKIIIFYQKNINSPNWKKMLTFIKNWVDKKFFVDLKMLQS